MHYKINTTVSGSVGKASRILFFAAILPMLTIWTHGQMVSDFESGEGFSAEQPAAGIGGWEGSNVFVVDSTVSKSGSQSIRIDSTSADGTLTNAGLLPLELKAISSWFLNTESTGPNWGYHARYYTWVSDGNTSEAFQYSVRYHTNTQDYNLHFTGGSGNGVVALAAGVYKPEDWNHMAFTVDTENMEYSILLNGHLILTRALNSAMTDEASISSYQFRRPSMGSTYYDLVAVPEPAHVALSLGIVALVVFFRLRSRRIN